MSKKRFISKPYDSIRCNIYMDNVDIAEVHRDDAKGLCDLLNNFHEENIILKSTNIEYEDALGRLEEKNEILELDKKLLFETLKEIRDKISIYLEVKGYE